VSLRARLLIVTVVLVAAGLLVADLATYRYLSGFLVQRLDQQLLAAQRPALFRLQDSGPPIGPGPGEPEVPTGSYAALMDDSGRTLHDRFFPYDGDFPPPVIDVPMLGTAEPSFFTTRTVDGEVAYRVVSQRAAPNVSLVVATPLTEVQATLRRLFGVELLVSLVVLGAVAAFALWLVRVGLQPLEGMGRTAGAIAAGDLTRRVEPADERTEVGRLGIALNTMLSHIESAFEQRRRSEDRLRRFVADASHELRTPLTSIRGYAELFRRGADTRPEDLARSMANIEAEASRMGVLVDDLLLLARLDQGRPLEREPVDLAEVVTHAVESARAIEPDRTIELIADGPVGVIGDAGRLRQVVDNLLDNARVHAPGSTVHVTVSREEQDAVLLVEDEGPGIDPDVGARIFERFTRGDPSRSRGTGGAGLGLSIVAAIVEAHEGSVTAGSGSDGGTEVTVRLPVGGPPEAPTPDEPTA
jgi:two-component system, OmpR family, sensor kinase